MKLKELSENLGLSQTTVSRALNGYPEVSEVTRRRVMLAAEAGNYLPDSRATRLATGMTKTIGHVVPVANQNDVFNPTFTEFIASASETYAQFGYVLILSTTRSQTEESIFRSLTAARAVDGVVIHSPETDDKRLSLLRDMGMPFVVHGRVLNEDDYNWVDMDNENAFKHATQLLIDLGHRRIALLNGFEHLTFAFLRKRGYTDALKENGIDVCEEIMAADYLTESYGYHTATQMLAETNAPTAFLVSSYVVALGVRRAISHAGLVIGEDVSVIIHDDELSYFGSSTGPCVERDGCK